MHHNNDELINNIVKSFFIALNNIIKTYFDK